MRNDRENSPLTEVRRSITVGRPAHELYAIWRDPQNLATLLRGLVEVTPTAIDRAHWTMRGQLGTKTEWDAALVLDIPSEAISWESVEDQGPERGLSIRFAPAPANQGTEAVMVFRFDPPGGVIGEALSKLFSIAPDLMLVKVLHRFKALAETGEVPTLEWNPSHRAESEQAGEQQ
ncbi:MAG TPA: SRPBCC family protein [Polyangiaceae bacterium]|nr:SRPBCC family protein [Polyangiaceae bacterium]